MLKLLWKNKGSLCNLGTRQPKKHRKGMSDLKSAPLK